MRWIVRFAVLAALGAGVWFGWHHYQREETLKVRTVKVEKGALSLTVTATGRLAPTTEVLVGCEVSGLVGEVNVGHNDRVHRGQVLATIKPELYNAEYKLALAEQGRFTAQLTQLEVQEREAKREFDRVERLIASGAASPEEHAHLLAAYDAAKASSAAGRAAIEGADSRVALAKYRLDRTIITSPIDGIVLDRRVDVGQTVIAALQSPTLFVLAEDLARMELMADVSESDIGFIAPGQRVIFTVNAYRDREFEGSVKQVRNQPTRIGDVVTYTVVVVVGNDDLMLRPGMPADLHIEILNRDDLPKVANSALRFRPPLPPDDIRVLLEDQKWPPPPAPLPVGTADAPATAPAGTVPPPIHPEKGTLWKYADERWSPVSVWTSFTDNRETALVDAGDLGPGDEVVVEVEKIKAEENMFQKALMLQRPENRKL